MATKTLKVVRAGKYATRDLKAGDPYEATGPEARLYKALGWMADGEEKPVVKAKAPRKRRAKKTA